MRGEVLEDEPYATWALDLRGSYQGRVLGAHLDAADAALAELDFAPALAHAEAAAALDRFSERAHRTADARSLRARPSARRACAATGASACGSTRSSVSSRQPRRARSRRRSCGRRTSTSLLPRPIRVARATCRGRSIRLLGRTGGARHTRTTPSGKRSTAPSPSSRSRPTRAREDDDCSTRSRTSSRRHRSGRARCSQLEQHLPYVPLAAALRERSRRRARRRAAAGAGQDPARARARQPCARVRPRSRCSRRSSRCSSPSTRPSC